MKCVDITEHEKDCEIETVIIIGYNVSGYSASISAYQFMCSKNTNVTVEYFVEINA